MPRRPRSRLPTVAPTPATAVAWKWLALFLLFLAIVAIAYQPAWRGGMLWDDDGHITRSDLRQP